MREIRANDKLLDIIEEDYAIIPLLSRFSVPLGFGYETVSEICAQEDIDVDALLLILNYIRTGIINESVFNRLSPLSVVKFLKNSHDYFLNYKFPHIRQNLISALDSDHSDINPGIIKFFDDFVKKVVDHFSHEEEYVFPYVQSLINGERSDYRIDIFRSNHEEVSEDLTELKSIILRYYRTSVPNRMYDVLVDIYDCEADMKSHTDLENNLLVPIVASFERRNVRE